VLSVPARARASRLREVAELPKGQGTCVPHRRRCRPPDPPPNRRATTRIEPHVATLLGPRTRPRFVGSPGSRAAATATGTWTLTATTTFVLAESLYRQRRTSSVSGARDTPARGADRRATGTARAQAAAPTRQKQQRGGRRKQQRGGRPPRPSSGSPVGLKPALMGSLLPFHGGSSVLGLRASPTIEAIAVPGACQALRDRRPSSSQPAP
jgi:hypothetical protein